MRLVALLLATLLPLACRSQSGPPVETKVEDGGHMLEIVQLLAGRDFARGNPFAEQMANYVYLVADPKAGECVLVDAAWDVRGLLDLVAARKLKLVGAIATHCHWDHVGGRFGGTKVEGVAELTRLAAVPVWANDADADRILRDTGLDAKLLRRTRDGDAVKVGGGEIRLLHTPGHTPGCQCLRVGKAVITGDTLFVGQCGRVDLPGSSPEAMFNSLKILAALPDDTVVHPGHNYGPTPTSTIAEERHSNACMGFARRDDWKGFVEAP
jgi:glyoxylase-like metal-dependent hydrolase (beta-lactamase superfamily II)